MRDRSETIYAESEEEFKQKMILLESRRERARHRKKKFEYEEESQLSFNKELEESFQSYRMVMQEPSIEEKERMDEKKLYETIETMNLNFRKKSYKNSYKENMDPNQVSCSLSYSLAHKFCNEDALGLGFGDESEVVNEPQPELFSPSYKCENEISPEASKKSTANNTLSIENSGISNLEAFVNQNLINFDEILKFILIGDKGVGKSLFVNKYISEENDSKSEQSRDSTTKYAPTETLEIKKTFSKIKDKNIKIELWDTNLNVLNSQIIKTYLKLSNGFILIADYDKIESVSFLEKQIENIINYSNFHNNILFILNKKDKKHKVMKQINNISYSETINAKLKMIHDRFNISPIEVDLFQLTKNNREIRNFVHQVLLNKSGKSVPVRMKPKSSTKIDHKSPKKVAKKTPNSNKNTNTNSPFNLNRSVPLNLSQKRTHSVKRNLTEVFKKLSLIGNESE